jgi:hypothetical protein
MSPPIQPTSGWHRGRKIGLGYVGLSSFIVEGKGNTIESPTKNMKKLAVNQPYIKTSQFTVLPTII